MLNRMILALLLFVIAGCSGSAAAPTPTPTITPTLLPSLTPTVQPSATPFPTFTPAPEITPEVTDEVIEIVLEGIEVDSDVLPAPIEVDLPDGWQQFDHIQPVQDVDGIFRAYPFTAYVGPVTGGQGFIIVIWGFASVTSGFGLSVDVPEHMNMGLDASRLLRLAIAIGCNVGNNPDNDTEFRIGDQIGNGSNWAAVDCPDGAVDTKGWYAGLRFAGFNYAFYAFAEPIEAMDGAARDELQAILDSVVFLYELGESE